MPNLDVSEMRAFVPAKEYNLARQFYTDFGFTESWTSENISVFRLGSVSFLLQNFYKQEMVENFMMQLMVPNLDEWWTHLQELDLVTRYEGVIVKPPFDYSWGLREIHLIDPSGVLWHITQVPH